MARKVKYDFNPFSKVRLRGEKREQAKAEIMDYVREQTLKDVGSARSPVTGERFQKLSSDYRSKKIALGGRGIANLELEGDLLAAFDVIDGPKGTIRVTFDEDQQGKADGHHNFSGKSKLPRRPMVPDANAGETFKDSIEAGIDKILRRYRDGS